MKRILRPLMPPWSLIILKYASSVRSIAPYAPAGPSWGPQLPTTTSVSVTPGTIGLAVAAAVAVADVAGGVVADPHAAASSATIKGTTSATRRTVRSCILESRCIKNALLLAFPALVPEICASHLLPLPERRAAIPQDHASGLQDVGMVGDAESHMRVLLDEEHGRARSADLADDAEDLLDQQRCESKGRLIEQKQAWPCHQRPSDGEHLLL